MNQSFKIIIILISSLLITACENSDNESNQKEKYIVVLKKKQVILTVSSTVKLKSFAQVVRSMVSDVSAQHNVVVDKSFVFALQGGVFYLNKEDVEALRNDFRVAYVEKDQPVQLNLSQSDAGWGLDRTDQEDLPLDNLYESPQGGAAVNAYVIDTGVLVSHDDFQGRAQHGFDFVDNDNDATDCNGHGTHVAGTVGGAQYGVAKNVNIIGVRVLDCFGSGSFSDVIAGVEWVTVNHIKPAVVNMSLGGPTSQAVDDAVKASIEAGVSYAVAAGNSSQDACSSSPARVARAITVGSSTNQDQRSSFSNYGSCLNIYAPGSDIKSAWYNSNTASNTISGTSMAAPHVAGVVALYLAQNPQAGPDEVREALVSNAQVNKLSDVRSGSPNLLLNTEFLLISSEPDPPVDPEEPDESEDQLSNGDNILSLSGNRGELKKYQLVVPEGASALSFTLSDGTGDADLYVKFNEEPSQINFDCRPYVNGNNEDCEFKDPNPGIYYVMIRAFSNYTGASLQVNYEEPVEPKLPVDSPCSNCDFYAGSLDKKGHKHYLPEVNGYNSSSGRQQFWLRGPEGSDFDIYLYKKENNKWRVVSQSLSLSSNESIDYHGSDGVYRLEVLSYKGRGVYKLWGKTP
jgi:serine protease